MRTVEAIIDETGQVKLLESIRLPTTYRALVTILENEQPAKQIRPFGLCAGDFVVPDDFDAPLPDEVLEHFKANKNLT